MKYNDNYSVFRLPCSKRYYLTHPHKWIADIKHNIRDAYRRAKYGWTWSDVWNFYDWFLTIVPDMLHHLAENGCGYPGREPFDTPEHWHEWLHKMADLLESGRDDTQNACNEYYKEYMDHLMENWTARTKDENGWLHSVPNISEADKQYFKRAEVIGADAENNVANAMRQLGEHFYSLWD